VTSNAVVGTALIGYGLAGRVIHRPLVQAEPRMRLSHIVTSNSSRRDEARRDAPSALLLERVEELWARSDEFDAVVIATSNLSHVQLAFEAIMRGKATVVDKPLALTAAEAQRVCDEASDRGVPVSVFHNRRWDSDTLTAAWLLAWDRWERRCGSSRASPGSGQPSSPAGAMTRGPVAACCWTWACT